LFIFPLYPQTKLFILTHILFLGSVGSAETLVVVVVFVAVVVVVVVFAYVTTLQSDEVW